jgi:hypothetical protein
MEDGDMTNTKKLTGTETRDELRAIAKELEIAGRGQLRKPELIAAIEEAQRLDAFAEEVFNGIQPETPAEAMERIIATAPKVDPMLDLHRMVASVRITSRKQRQKAMRKPERGLLASGKVMPLHYRGRAIGAKHLNIRVAASRSNEEFLELTIPVLKDIATKAGA